jgi:hypothetical protein
MNKKVKLSFGLPEELHKELQQKVIDDGYGMRGKSKWIGEAISQFLNFDTFIDLVELGDEMKGFQKLETLLVHRDIKLALDKAVILIKEKHHMLEGLQSRIIRTSILQRLLRS